MASMLSALMETTNKLNLTLVKTPPTRFQGSDTPSILDVIFFNKPEKLGNPTLFETSSDHKLIVIKKELKVRKTVMPIRRERSFAKYSNEKNVDAAQYAIFKQTTI